MTLERSLRDPERLRDLCSTRLLDTLPEESFDRYVRLAKTLLAAPTILISLVEADRQFFKAHDGLPEPYATTRETPLSHSFCQHVVHSQEPLVIFNARTDPLVKDNLAVRDLGVVAYLGVPLRSLGGKVLGSLCALDGQPRIWTPHDIALLTDVAASVSTEIQLREARVRLGELDGPAA